MKIEREAVDALAREIRDLIQRLRPVLERGPASWPSSRTRVATTMSRDLAAAVGHALPALVREEDSPSLAAAIRGFEVADWNAEWIGRAVRATGPPFQMALTAAVVRHTDRSVYRVTWSVRDISRRPGPD